MVSRLYTKGAVSDLILMEKLSNEEINNNLKKRFTQDNIYTYIGPVLISVNPFRMIKNLYGDAMIREYYGRYLHEHPPHVYALAEDAYRTLRYDRENQCIIISGESGAGKTEASKLILQYIAAVSNSGANSRLEKVKEKILSSNPVLESFGNAKTLRNDNSSRFGKYMELMFDHAANPIGGTVQNFLLEKSRIVNTAMGERNFHIFYRLKAGLSKQELSQFKLDQPLNSFKYLSKSNCFDVPKMDDRQEFQDMLHGLESLGTSSQEIKEVFATVAAVLWIGQIEFRQVEGKKTDVEIVDLAPVRIVANLIQCDEGALTQALMTRQYAAGNTKAIAANLSLEQAYYTRDALAKTIYFRLFDFIVGQVNKAMHISHSIGNKLDTKYPSIGVLDIYGFEIFENNSFEQFCINFVNEKLQQIFIENTLRAEQDEYKAEKIEWTPVEFFNNKIVCDLFESKPKGIFNFLDEACIIPQGDDNSFLRCLDEQFMSHPHYSKPEDKNIKMTAFTVRHYAGDVTYQNAGFVDKNKDLVWYDLLHMGESSKMSIFQMMFPYGGATRMQNSKKRPLTAGTQFKSQVASLMKHLSASTPHYIRCIKPNDNKQAGSYVDERVLHQICYLGLLENVRVRRAGFAFRQTFERFLKRYKMVCKTTWPSYHGDPKNGVELILDEMNLHGGSDYQMGVTKVFIRKPESLFELEEFRERAVNELVKKIQKVYKGWKARKYFLELREKALGIYNGKKARRRLSVKFFFVGDYINGEEDALLKEELRNQGSTKIIFADTVDKINKKNVSQQRKIILADSSLFFMKVDKKGKYQTQRQIPLSKISSFSLSPFVDNWLVIHVRDEYDYVIICERKTELLTTISEALTKFGTKLDLNISENITFKLKSKSERSIQFIEDKSISQVSWGLAKGKKNTIQVVVGDIATATRSQVADAASQVKKKKAQAETNFSKYVQRTSSHEKPVAPAVRKVQEASKEPGELYRAVAQYQTNDSEELSFEFGDIFRVLEKREDGWWVAIEVETGYKGFIPSNYVTKYE